jgi:hypothetical protein
MKTPSASLWKRREISYTHGLVFKVVLLAILAIICIRVGFWVIILLPFAVIGWIARFGERILKPRDD